MGNKFNRPDEKKVLNATDKEIEKLVNKGGDVPSSKKEKPENSHINLRVPTDILEKIAENVESKRPRKSRNLWILEAICDKLEREESKE